MERKKQKEVEGVQTHQLISAGPFWSLVRQGRGLRCFWVFLLCLFFFFLTLHSLLNVFITTCIASIISSIFQNILIYEIFQFFIVPKVACKPIELPFESESSKTKIKHYTKISISNVYYDFHQIHIIIYADFELIVCGTG